MTFLWTTEVPSEDLEHNGYRKVEVVYWINHLGEVEISEAHFEDTGAKFHFEPFIEEWTTDITGQHVEPDHEGEQWWKQD